jgi:hypothetical protein
MSIGFLAPTPPPQHQAYAYTPISRNTQSDFTFSGSNIDDDGPTTTLTFHDKRHCHQYIQDHPGLAVDKKDCTGAN